MEGAGCIYHAFIPRRRYLYEASSLCVIPHLPLDVTSLEQKLPVRWGHYQIFISTTGSRTHGITAVALNGKPLPLSHAGSGGSSFNRTVVLLEYDALPTPSAAAVSAMGSTELAIFDALTLNITFGASVNPRPAAAPPPPLRRSRLQRAGEWAVDGWAGRVVRRSVVSFSHTNRNCAVALAQPRGRWCDKFDPARRNQTPDL